MSETKGRGRLLRRLFIVFCIVVVTASIAVLLARFRFMDPVAALLVGLSLFFVFVLLNRQFELSREIQALKDEFLDVSAYEDDIEHRLGNFAQQLSGRNEGELASLTRQNTALYERLSDLSKRLNTLESVSPNMVGQVKPAPAALDDEVMRTDVHPDFNEETATTKVDKANLNRALKKNQLAMHLQPIVQLPARSPAFFEAFMRLKVNEKQFLDARKFIKVAESGGLMPLIDKKVLFSSVRMLNRLEELKKKTGLFCNLSSSTLQDEKIFGEFLRFLKRDLSINDSLVFEISQHSFTSLSASGLERLKQITDLGFTLSLDQVLDLRLDLSALAEINFKFIKVPAPVLLSADIKNIDGMAPSRLAHELKKHDMALIATEVERETDVLQLFDLDITYGQGRVFAPPRAVKAELLDGIDDKQSTPAKLWSKVSGRVAG